MDRERGHLGAFGVTTPTPHGSSRAFPSRLAHEGVSRALTFEIKRWGAVCSYRRRVSR